MKRVLITGGSRGIGAAIAKGVGAAGHEVVVVSRTSPDTGVEHLPCDLRSPDAVHRSLSAWLAKGSGRVDAIVHSAVAYGSTGRHPFTASTVGEWDDALEVNARGLMLVLLEVLPAMLNQDHGIVLGISSDIATIPGPGRIPYAASKAAAHAIMIGLAAEVADSAISVVELMPTLQVDTPGIRSRRPADFVPSEMAAAETFVGPTLHLIGGSMSRYNGACLLVDEHGQLIGPDGEFIAAS